MNEELRSMKEMLKQAQNEKESSLELLETERKCSQMKALEKDTAGQKTVEQQIELTQLKERNVLLQKENASMQKDISAKDSANHLLQKELEDKSGVELNLQDEISTMKGEMDKLYQAIKSEQSNVCQLQLLLDGANSQLKSSNEETIIQKEAFEQKVSELLQKNEKLKEMLKQAQNEKESSLELLETERKGEMDKLYQAIKSEQSNVSQLQMLLDGANSQLKSTKEETIVQKEAFEQKMSE